MHGASGAIACSALCAGKGEYPALNGAAQRSSPSPEVMQLMVKAARAGLDKQRGLDERAGRGFVRYPARAGEPERSGRRGYDDDQRWRRGQVRTRVRLIFRLFNTLLLQYRPK